MRSKYMQNFLFKNNNVSEKAWNLCAFRKNYLWDFRKIDAKLKSVKQYTIYNQYNFQLIFYIKLDYLQKQVIFERTESS